MTTTTTINLIKCRDGSYAADLGTPFESNLYVVRKRTQDEMYDPDREYRERGLTHRYGTKLRPAPKPTGWMVEHADLAEPQPVATLDAAKDLIQRHGRGFWWSRCAAFAEAIDVDMADTPTPELIQFVLDKVTEYKLTVSDFWELDERPGQFTINGEGYSRRHWHRNLRVTRNSTPDLFDRLAR